MVRGAALSPDAAPGVDRDALKDLAERMKTCRCGVIFFGLGLARRELGHCNVAALLRLVTDLNAHTRFHARRMRLPGDVTGADSVLCWQTGFPFAVNFARGYPRYNPAEYSADALLARREVDACLLVGSEAVGELSREAQEHLRRIPTIALDHPTVAQAPEPTIRFTTAVYGIHLPGTAYRMDEVPIPLRPILPPKYPSDAAVLAEISARLPTIKGSGASTG
jgi:formylmethanofuran dehydrogenase subunit B